MTSAFAQLGLTAAKALHPIRLRRIRLTLALGGRVWVAGVDEFGDTLTTKKRKIRSDYATASTPIVAVTALLAILDGQPQEQEMFEEVCW